MDRIDDSLSMDELEQVTGGTGKKNGRRVANTSTKKTTSNKMWETQKKDDPSNISMLQMACNCGYVFSFSAQASEVECPECGKTHSICG